MDVNYSRWMSKDPDAEPEVIEDEPRRFRLPTPSRSAVASTAMVSLVVLGGGALVRSMATPEVTTDQAQTVETPTAEQSSGPGAASVDERTSDDPSTDYATVDDATLDDYASDDSTSEEAEDSSDDGTTNDDPAPPGPRLIVRRELRQAEGMPPGEPWRDHPPRPAPAPPMLRR